MRAFASNPQILSKYILQDREIRMPEKKTVEQARKAKREGKAPSTQAGAFVREEMDHIREGKHGAKSPQQAIAIGLSKARRSGVDLKPPKKGKASAATRKKAARDYEKGHSKSTSKRTSAKRSAATKKALKKQPRSAASHRALSKHAKSVARKRRSGPKRTGSSSSTKRASSKRTSRTKSK
jgi:hypothetical protein